MLSLNISNCSTIPCYVTIKTPFLLKSLIQKPFICTRWNSIYCIIWTHYSTNFTPLDATLKCWEVRICKILWVINNCIKTQSPILFGISCIMLTAARCSYIFWIRVFLKIIYILVGIFTSLIRILSWGFLPSTPSWISKNIDIRCPKSVSIKLILYCFRSYRVTYLSPHCFIENRTCTSYLRKASKSRLIWGSK